MRQDHPEQLADDAGDPIANTLRQQSNRARVSPSPELRVRTIQSLKHTQPHARTISRSTRRPWMTALAAAATLGFAVLVVRVLVPGIGRNDLQPSPSGPIARVPSTQPRLPRLIPDAPNVRVAALTQPLEREAEALRSDLRRISSHLRSAIDLRRSE